jgi:hypothetical protein
VADKNSYTHITQALRHRTFTKISPAYLVTEVVQHFGNTTHAGTADADEVHTAYPPHTLRLCHGCRVQCLIHADTS